MERENSDKAKCSICGSPALGINFGVMTCAPCKAFFRRNARRKELMQLPCRHRTFSSVINDNVYIRERAARYLQIRRCSSCRLRRCFEVGMKEELVRTDAENQRHRELVEINRKRREALNEELAMIYSLSMPQTVQQHSEISEGIDWCHLSNIVYCYDTQCAKAFVEKRSIAFPEPVSISDHEVEPVGQPAALNKCIVSSVLSFLQSLPAFYSLTKSTRNHLCKTNLRPLIFPNVHELEQCCFASSWQSALHTATWKMICGPELHVEFRRVEKMTDEHLIKDPVVTRLWIITLFFSTPLHYHNYDQIVTPLLKKKQNIFKIQNAYGTLLWKYLVYRHQEREAVRIFSNLIRIYLKMQQVGYGIFLNLQSKQELASAQELLHKLVTTNLDDTEEIGNLDE